MFIWSDKLETKIELVDMQHKNLFDLLNKLSVNIKSGDITYDDVSSSTKLLIHYTETHLHDEELIMIDARIDKRHLNRHRMEHNSFLYDVSQFSDITSSDDRRVTAKAIKLVRFITYWLLFHILGTDMLMAAQIKSIKAGISPELAFDKLKDHTLDAAAVGIMLDAVVNLWKDAKERCGLLEKQKAELEKKLQAVQFELDYTSINQIK